MSAASEIARRLARGVREGTFINTINVRDRVAIEFVWYPGAAAADLDASLVDTFVPENAAGANRLINYVWQRDGAAEVRREMNSGRVTVDLPPNTAGTLTCFGTQWRITRVANGVGMQPANTLRGVQERLDRLGYHLRGPGAANPGIDGSWGARSEHAVIQFQNDYRPAAGAAAGANARLRLRGEWTTNTGGNYTFNLSAYNGGTAVAPNPSIADGTALQNALVARVGS